MTLLVGGEIVGERSECGRYDMGKLRRFGMNGPLLACKWDARHKEHRNEEMNERGFTSHTDPRSC